MHMNKVFSLAQKQGLNEEEQIQAGIRQQAWVEDELVKFWYDVDDPQAQHFIDVVRRYKPN